MPKIAVVVFLILISSIFRAVVDAILGVETSGPLASRVISQLITMLTGVAILCVMES